MRLGASIVLEIFVVIGLCKQIGAILRKKGRKAGWYQFLVVVAWVGGEIAGGVIAGIISAITNPGAEPHLGLVYLLALAGAATSVAFVFLFAKGLPDQLVRELPYPHNFVPENASLPSDTSNPYQPPLS